MLPYQLVHFFSSFNSECKENCALAAYYYYGLMCVECFKSAGKWSFSYPSFFYPLFFLSTVFFLLLLLLNINVHSGGLQALFLFAHKCNFYILLSFPNFTISKPIDIRFLLDVLSRAHAYKWRAQIFWSRPAIKSRRREGPLTVNSIVIHNVAPGKSTEVTYFERSSLTLGARMGSEIYFAYANILQLRSL